jgi:aspartokinase-like uncharacterized kinase
MDVVVKLGGRLGRGDRLPHLCARLAELGTRHRLLVVPGGGAFADAVRDSDMRFGLSSSATHWMAMLAMDQYGLLLADLTPRGEAVRSLEAAAGVAANGAVPVLLPYDLVRRADALPHSWQVTSDSVAAWVAGLSEARLLVVLKDAVGMRSRVRGSDVVPSGRVTLETLALWEAVDDQFASLAETADCDVWLVDGEAPERLDELLGTGCTKGVSLERSAS